MFRDLLNKTYTIQSNCKKKCLWLGWYCELSNEHTLILFTFHDNSRTFIIASSGHGPFSFCVMIGVFSSFHFIHLMWYNDWPATLSLGQGIMVPSAPCSLWITKASPLSSSPSLLRSELGQELRLEKDSSESKLRDSPAMLGSLPLGGPSETVWSFEFELADLALSELKQADLTSFVASCVPPSKPSACTLLVSGCSPARLFTNFEVPPSLFPAAVVGGSYPIPLLSWSVVDSVSGKTVLLTVSAVSDVCVQGVALAPLAQVLKVSLFSQTSFIPPTVLISAGIAVHRTLPPASRWGCAFFSISLNASTTTFY